MCMKKKINAHENILSLIGNTPLIKLNKVTKDFEGSYYAKYEAMNPGQSNKDRIALHIIDSAEKKGLIDKNTTIIVIAHRLSTITGADNIIVLDRGHMAESGSQSELIKKNGIY